MNADVIRDVLSRQQELERRGARYRQGVVTVSSPLAITLGGSTTAYAGVKRLGSYTPTVGDVVSVLMFGNDLLVLGRIAGTGGSPLVTALPTGVAGDEVILQTAAMAALSPPVAWYLRSDGTKWVYIGGAPILAEIDAYTTLSAPDRTVTSTTYVALAVAGPSVALPVVGWYHVELSFSAYHNTAGAQSAMSYDIGATGAVDVDSASFQAAVSNTDVQRVTRSYPKQFASAVTLTSKFRTTAGTATFRGSKTLKVTPVYLG